MFFLMSDRRVGRYLNARLKNCAFPDVDENNKRGLLVCGETRGNAPKFVRFNGNAP